LRSRSPRSPSESSSRRRSCSFRRKARNSRRRACLRARRTSF
jgi:hypothetical protein